MVSFMFVSGLIHCFHVLSSQPQHCDHLLPGRELVAFTLFVTFIMCHLFSLSLGAF